MKPLHAKYKYITPVPLNMDKQEHQEWVKEFGRTETVDEVAYMDGFVIDIIPLSSYNVERVIDGKNDKEENIYKGQIGNFSTATVVFLGDSGDHFKLMVVPVNTIITSRGDILDYINKQ